MEDGFDGSFEPVFEDRGVDVAEIHGVDEVAPIEFFQAGGLAVEAGLDFSPEEEHWGCGAVVGALAGVFSDAAAEFAEGHREHAVEISLRLEVGGESRERGAEFSHESAVVLWSSTATSALL